MNDPFAPDMSPEERFRQVGAEHGTAPQAAANGSEQAAVLALPFVLFGDIEAATDANDFVEGLLTSASLVVVYGDPGCGKTFWVLDLCLHIAAGYRWSSRDVEQGAVVYLALEGGAGIRNRIVAARDSMQLPASTPMVLVQTPVDLCKSGADVRRVIATIEIVADRLKMPIRVVVVDTLARALGGGDENGPSDMGALVVNADHIRHETGVCVIFIHHCGKDASKGARGHNSLKAATDTEIEILGGDKTQHTANVRRQRDLPSDATFAFNLVPVVIGTNRRGVAVTSCVVEHLQAPAPQTADKPSRTNPNEKIGLRALEQAIKDRGVMVTVFEEYTEGLAAKEADWRAEFYRLHPGEKQDSKKTAFSRITVSLLAKKLIGSQDGFIWPIGRPLG